MQRDLLWILEEAGAETRVTIQVTLKSPSKTVLDETIEGLARLGYIRLDGSETVALTPEGRKALTV